LYKLAIFDFDGTLVDSAPGIVDVMFQVAEYYDFPGSVVEHWKQLIGVPLNDQTEIILPGTGRIFQEEVADKYREFYNSRCIELCPPFPSLFHLLETLRNANITITIASSKKKTIIDPVLEHHNIQGYFSLVIGAEGVKHHKPHPEAVLNTLKHHKCSRDDAVVIGDSNFDLEMARNAGVDAIGVSTGVHGPEILRQATPISVVGSLTDALELILNGRNKVA